MFAGEFVLDLGLALMQPVHSGVELVLAGVGDLEVFGQCRRVPPAGCRQLGMGRNNPRGHHRQNDVAFASRANYFERLIERHESRALQRRANDLDQLVGQMRPSVSFLTVPPSR
jgi:hypothetical protein